MFFTALSTKNSVPQDAKRHALIPGPGDILQYGRTILRFLRGSFFFWWGPFLFRRDVNGIGFVQALLEIADGKPQPPADLGNLPPPEK